jgi:hypothetical protein
MSAQWLIYLANQNPEAHPAQRFACIKLLPARDFFASQAGDGFGFNFPIPKWFFVGADRG